MAFQDFPEDHSPILAPLETVHPPRPARGRLLEKRLRHTRSFSAHRLWVAFLPFILLSGLLTNWALLIPAAFAAPAASYTTPGTLTYQQAEAEGSRSDADQGAFQRPIDDPNALNPETSSTTSSLSSHAQTSATTSDKPLPSFEPPSMQPVSYTLDDSFVLHRPTSTAKPPSLVKVQGTAIPTGTQPLIVRGSDGRFEVDVPRGSLDFAHAYLTSGGAPVGQLVFQISQLAGHYIESDSILGTYQLQVVDSQGDVVQGVTVTRPLTLVYHYQSWEMHDLDLNPNEIRFAWSNALAQATAAHQPTTSMVLPATNNAAAHTLTVQTTLLAGSLTASGTPEIEAPPTPNLFSISGNSGQYSYSYPLDVAPGPDGFAPQLALQYSSESVNERHSRRSPGGDEGDGWSLPLGSITATVYPASTPGGGGTYYSLNDVAGVSDFLVPSSSMAGYYDTQHISHLLIHFTGTSWQVWGLDGTYYEFGNTSDSVRTDASGKYEWDLDRMVAPSNSSSQLKTMLVSYLQDVSGSTTRDAGIKQIQYGFATSLTATTLTQVAGTVDFHYLMPNVPSGASSFAATYSSSYYSACAAPAFTTLRCDDPIQYGTTVPAPDVMNTMTLTSVASYVGTDSATTGGSPAYQYGFIYHDLPFTSSYFDPYTQVQSYAAGDQHQLTQIIPTVYVQGTAQTRKGMAFGYTASLTDSYNDPVQKTTSGNEDFSGQTFWTYLDHEEDLETGEGANVNYAEAYANTNGTPYTTDGNGNVTDDRLDPLYCEKNASNSDPSKQCTGTYGLQDNYSWGLQVVTQIAALGTDSTGNTNQAVTTYNYALTPVASSNMPGTASCHPITGTGVPAQEADCTVDNYSPYYFNTNPTTDSNWANYYDAQFRGFNVVYITSPAGDLTTDYSFTTAGWYTGAVDGRNYNGGQMYQQDIYQGDVAIPQALLQETLNDYVVPVSVPAENPYTTINTCNGNENAIYVPCVAAALETKTTTYDGQGGSSSAPWVDTKYTYDDVNLTTGYAFAGYHNLTQEVISSSNAATVTKKWTYSPHNQVVSGQQYYDVNKVTHSEIDDSSGHVWQCQDTTYDEGLPSGVPAPNAGLATTTTAYSTCGTSTTAIKSYTGYDQYGNVVETVDGLGAANPSFYSSNGCTLGTVPVTVSAAWTAGRYTSCTTYDTGHTNGLPTSTINVLGQQTATGYDYTSGAFETSATDVNARPTSFAETFDSSGNQTIMTSEPGESGSYTTRQSEQSSCVDRLSLNTTDNPTQDLYPCYEIDTSSALYSGAVTQTLYDSQGRKVETITPGPTPGDDTVVISAYDDVRHSLWTSEPFEIAAGSYGTGWISPSAVNDVNNVPPAGTFTFYDALNRVVATQDENYLSTQEPGVPCSTTLSGTFTACTNYTFGQTTGDTAYYAETTNVDPNGHVTQAFADALDNTRYTQTNSGVYGGTVAVVRQVKTVYNVLNKPTTITTTDEASQSGEGTTSVTVSSSYDDLGRVLTMSDPDQGTFTTSYDPDGRILSTVQTSGTSSRTLGFNYDLLGRIGCEQTAAPTINATGACSAGNSLMQNTYDTNELGTQGSTDFPIGKLTQSVATTYYPDSTSATVTEQLQYDQRGRTVAQTVQLGVPSSWGVTTSLPTDQFTETYNDADQPTTTTVSAGSQSYTFTQVYDATNGVQQGLSNNSSATANLAQLTYNEFSQLGGITLLNGASTTPTSLASETFNYDADLRPTSLNASWLPGSGNSGQILGQSRTYDNASNVTGTTTTYATVSGQSGSGGSETQNFCYDSQNRLIWAGNSGTQPSAGTGTCGSSTLANTLSGAGYTNSYSYTNLGQLWQGPLNGTGSTEQDLYCNSAPHELTGIYPVGTTCANKGSVTALYSASYDLWGNETSRMYHGVTETLSYDALNHLVRESGSNSTQESYLYDASGNRVLTRSTNASTTSLTIYAFGLQELTYTSIGTYSSQFDYYTIAGHLIGWSNGSTITYDLTDALDSMLLSFSSSAVLGEQIYGPYGNQRYLAGTLGTDKGYTGQFADAVTGLDYYNSRWYDPAIGMFLSVDNVQGNMQGCNPFAYVSGNPETMGDPTGRWGWGTWGLIGAAVAVVAVAAACVVAPEVMLPALAAVSLASTTEGTVGVGIGMFVGMGGSLGSNLMVDAVTQQTPTAAGLATDIIGGGLLGAISPINPVTDWEGTGSEWSDPSLVDLDNLNQQMDEFGRGIAKNGIFGGLVHMGRNRCVIE